MKKDMSRYTDNNWESKTYRPAMKECGFYLIAMRRLPSQASEGRGTRKGIAVWKLGIVHHWKDFPEKKLWESLLNTMAADNSLSQQAPLHLGLVRSTRR